MAEIDYTGDYLITVEPQDLCNAVPGDPYNCAIAQAAKRCVPEMTYLRVGKETIEFTDRTNRKRIKVRTSLRALRAVEKFDEDPSSVTADDFGVIHLHMTEAQIEDIEFNERKRKMQNKRRAEIREGKRVPKPMSQAEREKRRFVRRHA